MTAENGRTIEGQLTVVGFNLPRWAWDSLYVAVWDRDDGPESPLFTARAEGAAGTFRAALSAEAAGKLAMVGLREGPQCLAAVGWGEALDPVLAVLPWPRDWAEAPSVRLAWDGSVSVIGYAERLHIEEVGDVPLGIVELAGRVTPYTYDRLPPLPQPALGDRHRLHVDRPFEDRPEQVYYLLVDMDTAFGAVAQDALVSTLKLGCTASLAPDDGGWHERVNLPLLVDAVTLIAP